VTRPPSWLHRKDTFAVRARERLILTYLLTYLLSALANICLFTGWRRAQEEAVREGGHARDDDDDDIFRTLHQPN